MKRIGLTGGIGCGKSTVLAGFARLGIPCFEADKTAAAYYTDPTFVQALSDMFGNAVIDPNGNADKRKIAAIVFADHSMLQRLNALVHPRVLRDYDRFCAQHASAPYTLFESAILFDHRLDKLMYRTVCVYLCLEERMQRLRLRDHVPDHAIEARMANQMPAEEMMRRADYVILNYEGNPRSRQIAHIDNLIKQCIEAEQQ